MAEYTAWQAAEKERAAAAKKLPRASRKVSKLQAPLPASGEVPASSEQPEAPQSVHADTTAADPSPKLSRPRKSTELTLHGIWGPGVPGRLAPDELTPATNAAQVTSRVLRQGILPCR